MARCTNCHATGMENPLLDAYGCEDCGALWCNNCGEPSVPCPRCASIRVWSFTLTDDAYL